MIDVVKMRRIECISVPKAIAICEQVKDIYGFEVSVKMVRTILKDEFNLSFVKAKKLTANTNADRALVLRQQFALKMLPLLKKGQRIINVDETWISETSFIRKTWGTKAGEGNTLLNPVTPRLAMITAIDTEGRVWFALTQVNTNSSIIGLFLQHFTAQLDREMPGW